MDGIKCQKIGEGEHYAQELFQQEELMGYLKGILQNAIKFVFEHVIYDSGGVERTCAEQFEKNEAVKIFAMLPAWAKVRPPLAPAIRLGGIGPMPVRREIGTRLR